MMGFDPEWERSFFIVADGSATPTHPYRNGASLLEVPGARYVSRDGCSLVAVYEELTH